MEAKEHVGLDAAKTAELNSKDISQTRKALQDIAFGSVSTTSALSQSIIDISQDRWRPRQIHRVSLRYCQSPSTVTAPWCAALHRTSRLLSAVTKTRWDMELVSGCQRSTLWRGNRDEQSIFQRRSCKDIQSDGSLTIE